MVVRVALPRGTSAKPMARIKRSTANLATATPSRRSLCQPLRALETKAGIVNTLDRLAQLVAAASSGRVAETNGDIAKKLQAEVRLNKACCCIWNIRILKPGLRARLHTRATWMSELGNYNLIGVN